jgi:hypothetical protein
MASSLRIWKLDIYKDIATAHYSFVEKQQIKDCLRVLPQPPYSPDQLHITEGHQVVLVHTSERNNCSI